MFQMRKRVRDTWMVEIASRVVAHAEPPHHRRRAGISLDGEGDNLFEPVCFKSMSQHRFGCFRNVTLLPEPSRKSPADFDRAVGKVWFKVCSGQPEKAYRLVRFLQGQREKAKPVSSMRRFTSSINASDSSRLRRRGKNSMTFGSALISANSGRSVSSQLRTRSLGVSTMITGRNPSSGNLGYKAELSDRHDRYGS